jgi:hypothetical protein
VYGEELLNTALERGLVSKYAAGFGRVIPKFWNTGLPIQIGYALLLGDYVKDAPGARLLALSGMKRWHEGRGA